ncbi:MAG: putative cytochrome P450 [Acidimicrobiia bacterium]
MSDIPGTLLLDPEVLEDPYPFYDRLRREAPVWRVPGTDVFVVSSFAAVAEVTGRVEEFSNHVLRLLYRDEHWLPQPLAFGDAAFQALASADPPRHTVHRRTVFPDLVARRMLSLESEVDEIAAGCIEQLVGRGQGDFMADVGNVVPITMISRLIGFHGSDPQRLLQAAFDSTLMIGVTMTLDELLDLVAKSDDIGSWISEQLTAGEAGQADDGVLLGTIARGVSDGAMTHEEGVIILHTLLSAGGESTTSLLGNAVRILAERPDLQQQLRDDPTLVPAFVEEAVRLESPFRFLLRSVPADTTLDGVDIPADATVLLFWGAANRDPDEFDHPDDVILDREVPRHHVAFGRGIHHCVGAPLARLEARTVLTRLLDETSSITLDPDDPPRRVPSLLVRRHETLPVIVVPRAP